MITGSLLVGIIFTSYAMHVHCSPYFVAENSKRLSNAIREGAVLAYVIPFNRVESGYLITSMITLMAGMVFQSGSVSVSSKVYLALTVSVRHMQCCELVPLRSPISII